MRAFCCFLLTSWFLGTWLVAEDSLPVLKKSSQKLAADVLNVKALHEAVKVCEKILELNEIDFETRVLFPRVCWSLGNHETEVRDQKKWFARGRDLADVLKKNHPEKPDGYYWYGVNYGEWVDRSSIFSKIGAKKIIMENMDKVIAIDPQYDSGGAYIVVGRINYISPGGKYSKAIECYEKAISIGPRRSTAYVYLGELYLHEHVFDKAEELFKKVLTMETDPRYAIEARDDRKLAETLIKKLDKKDDRFPEQERITGR
jgi:tetratricopeptide (TPR) repeat protein